METKYYLIEVEAGVEAFARGPFQTEAEQDDAAKQSRAAQDDDDGLFWADVDEDGPLTVGSYMAGFFLVEPADAST